MEDDWIISSLKSYEILHAFELPQPTFTLDWNSDGNVLYVGGSSLESNNEILELCVPEKILNPNNGLSSKRDFTLQRGGFSSTPICSLKCLHMLHKLVAVGYGDVVKVYSLDCQEKGVIKHLNDLRKSEPSSNCECYLSWNDSHPSAILCGCTVKTAALLDMEMDKILFQCNSQTVAPLNGLLFANESSNFFTLSSNGSIELWDPRMKPLDLHNDNTDVTMDYSSTVNYAMDVCGSSYEDSKLACVSRLCKQVAFYELRQWKKPLASLSLDYSLLPGSGINKHLCVKLSPHNDNLLSISGLSKGVGIYKMELPSKLHPLFTHFGHEAETADSSVLTHSWHLKIPKLLVSSSSDGSLHAWQWKSGIQTVQ